MNDTRTPLHPAAANLERASVGLANFPAVEKWDDWVEYDTAQWPRKVEKHCRIIPTICFNCEAACGLVAIVDKDSHRIRPNRPTSRQRENGPARRSPIPGWLQPDEVDYECHSFEILLNLKVTPGPP